MRRRLRGEGWSHPKARHQKLSRVSDALQNVLRKPDVIERLKAVGAYPEYEEPNVFNKRIANDSRVGKQVIEENGLRKLR